MIIKLIRHGESKANTNEMDPRKEGDYRIPLTVNGRAQARALGPVLGADFLRNALIYRSPFLRTRQTLDEILIGAGLMVEGGEPQVRIYEDPRLREIDIGYDDYVSQEPLRERHGWFYYRFRGGQSPADCYDRASGFLDSMWREVERRHRAYLRQAMRNVLRLSMIRGCTELWRWARWQDVPDEVIVTHGMTIRCLVMRFFHLTVEQFNSLRNPHNCDVITIAPKHMLEQPTFTCGNWGVTGLRLRPPGILRPLGRHLSDP